jgi:hypothetical protein
MITGVAVLGMLAGSLVSLFNLEPTSEKERADDAAPARPEPDTRSQPSWPCSGPNSGRSNIASANSLSGRLPNTRRV